MYGSIGGNIYQKKVLLTSFSRVSFMSFATVSVFSEWLELDCDFSTGDDGTGGSGGVWSPLWLMDVVSSEQLGGASSHSSFSASLPFFSGNFILCCSLLFSYSA